jgi:glycosyltransferase involved in cell wall biosynthesis
VRGPARREAIDEVIGTFRDALGALGAGHPAFAFPGPLAREIVHFLDRIAFDPSRVTRYFALSQTVAARAGYFPPGVEVRVALLPTDLAGLHTGPYEHFFTASRLDGPKRLDLLVQAMSAVRGPTRLRIAGTGPQQDQLAQLAAGDDRIELLGYVPDDELADHYARALAVPFVPLDEDWGLIAVEAMQSGKPVVTCTDSGGPVELVEDGTNGFVTKPTPRALGKALARLAADRSLAPRLGEAGRRRVESITWSGVVDALLRTGAGGAAPAAGGRALPDRRPGKPKVVVLSTFRVHPPMGGGQLRCFHLYGAMTERFDVEILSLVPAAQQHERTTLAAGFTQTVIPKSRDHERREHDIQKRVGMPVTDIVAGQLIERTPLFLETLRESLGDAAAVLLAHPYLLPAVDATGVVPPIVYDAHNAELQLKASVLPDDALGRELLEAVRAVEADAVRRAVLIPACSSNDVDQLVATYGADANRFLDIPNGTDLASVPFTPPDRRARTRSVFLDRFLETGPGGEHLEHVAVFFGSWHPPNLDAARHIIELAPDRPDMLFVLAGSHSTDMRSRKLPRNVAAMGVVSDTTKLVLLRSATVALNPMVRGSGTNLKVVEYLAAGAPVVTTAEGARGLAAADGEHLLLATLEGFPRAIASVVDDPAAAAERALRGRALVEERYDWHTLGRRLADAIAAAVAPTGRR